MTIIGYNLVTGVAFKNFAPFIKHITKIDETTIDDAEDLDLVVSMYNLLEYSSNYSDTTDSLWFYSKDEAASFNVNIVSNNSFKSFKYKTRLIRNAVADGAHGILRNATIAVSLKYLSNFLRSLEMLLTNCKVELKLTWMNHCVLSANGNDNTDGDPNNISFTLIDIKIICTYCHYINKRQPKLLREGFERSFY